MFLDIFKLFWALASFTARWIAIFLMIGFFLIVWLYIQATWYR